MSDGNPLVEVRLVTCGSCPHLSRHRCTHERVVSRYSGGGDYLARATPLAYHDGDKWVSYVPLNEFLGRSLPNGECPYLILPPHTRTDEFGLPAWPAPNTEESQ